jgi:hypothetical protein
MNTKRACNLRQSNVSGIFRFWCTMNSAQFATVDLARSAVSVSVWATCHVFQFIKLKGHRWSAVGQWNEFESVWLAGRKLGKARQWVTEKNCRILCIRLYVFLSFFLSTFFFRPPSCGKDIYRHEWTKRITTSAAWMPLYLCASF